MSSISETSVWLKFFTEAGIPPSDATTYAITFTDNRIKQEMILDLNKEYLRDMGITVMGDVIAILKYAKVHCAQKSRQKVMQSSTPTADTEKPNSSGGKKITPATRMLEHYVRKETIPPRSNTPPSRSKRPLDEDESISNKRNSVFNRLGDNSVSSTTSDNPKITVTMHGREMFRSSANESNSKSPVFQRIRREGHLNGSSDDREWNFGMTKPLEYHGIFKYSTKEEFEKAISSKKSIATMKADTTTGVKSRLGMKSVSANDITTSAGIFAKEAENLRTVKPPTSMSRMRSSGGSTPLKITTSTTSRMRSSGSTPLKITTSTTKNEGSPERTVRVVAATSSSLSAIKDERLVKAMRSKSRALEVLGEGRSATKTPKSRALEALGEGRLATKTSKSRVLEVLGEGRLATKTSKSRVLEALGEGRSATKSGVFSRLGLGK